MKVVSWFCIPALFIAFLPPPHRLAAEKEKVEEGRYALLKNGALVTGSEHSWTLWRLTDGKFEFEDHFQIDKYARTLVGTILSPGMPMTPEFQKSTRAAITPSDVAAIFDQNFKLVSLTVSGLKFNGDDGIGLKCKTSSASIECAGTDDKAKLRVHEPRGLFWWYGNPLLLRSWAAPAQETSTGSGPQKIAVLSFGNVQTVAQGSWSGKPRVEPADLTISNLGPETLVLGDKSLRAQKWDLEVDAKGAPVSLTVWTDATGLILAVEQASSPGDLIALMHYKKYSNSPPVAPTP